MNPKPATLGTVLGTALESDVTSKFGSELGENILVVVDMQVGFTAALEPWLLDVVEAEVRRANEASWSIIALEFLCPNPLRFYGNTHDRVVKAAQTRKENAADRQRFFMRAKAQMDGSDRVLDVCQKEGYQPKLFRVCGVKSRACVEATAVGLATRFPDSTVEVLTSACNQDGGNDRNTWIDFPVMANLNILLEK
jgi:nicotinamidase-related amidase